MKKYCFGVDIGGTFVKLGVFTTEGELLEKWEIKTRREDESSHILPDIAEALESKRKQMGILLEEVAGIGELWRGGAKGYKNAVVVPIGTGVGAASLFVL